MDTKQLKPNKKMIDQWTKICVFLNVPSLQEFVVVPSTTTPVLSDLEVDGDDDVGGDVSVMITF